MAGVVDRLQRHAAGEGAIADHRHAFVVVLALIAGQGHAEGRRDAGGGVAGTEMVEAALGPLQVARHPVLLPQGGEILVAARDQLVGVGLVAHIPHHLVLVEIEGLVEGEGEFHHPQARTEVTTAAWRPPPDAFPGSGGRSPPAPRY